MASKEQGTRVREVSYYTSPSAQRASRQQRAMLVCGFGFYVCLPALYIAAILLQPYLFPKKKPEIENKTVTKLLLPADLVVQARSENKPADDQLQEPTPEDVKQPIKADPPSENLPPVDVSEVHIPGSMPMSFDDPGNCLDRVLAGFGGYLGFAPVADTGYLTRKFELKGSTWQPVEFEGKESTARYEPTVKITKPYRWLLDIRRKYHLADREFVAYALFPPDFEDRMIQILRRGAAALGMKGNISSALLALDPQEGAKIVPGSIRTDPPGVSH